MPFRDTPRIWRLLSVQHGFQENLPFIQDQRIRLFQDNTNVVACLTKFSSRSKPFMDELYHLVPLFQHHQISLRAQHRGPSAESRRRNAGKFLATKSTTSSGATSRHRSICLPPIRGRYTLLHSTTPSNHHSAGFNDLLLDWSPLHVVYFNPPWHLLPQVLLKIKASQAKGVEVCPRWPL